MTLHRATTMPAARTIDRLRTNSALLLAGFAAGAETGWSGVNGETAECLEGEQAEPNVAVARLLVRYFMFAMVYYLG